MWLSQASVPSADPSLNAIASIVFVISAIALLGVELLLLPMLLRKRPAVA